MSEKYQFDTVRYCANNADRMGQMPNGRMVAALIAEEVAGLKAELTALKDAARPVVKIWSDAKKVFASEDVVMPVGIQFEPTQMEQWADITAVQLDAIARLVGEE